MKFKELQKKDERELQKTLQEFREKYQEMKFKVANNQLKNIRDIRKIKKNIAHILFLLKNRKLNPTKEVVQEVVKESK